MLFQRQMPAGKVLTLFQTKYWWCSNALFPQGHVAPPVPLLKLFSLRRNIGQVKWNCLTHHFTDRKPPPMSHNDSFHPRTYVHWNKIGFWINFESLQSGPSPKINHSTTDRRGNPQIESLLYLICPRPPPPPVLKHSSVYYPCCFKLWIYTIRLGSSLLLLRSIIIIPGWTFKDRIVPAQ